MKVGNSEWKQNDNGNDGPSVGSLQSLLIFFSLVLQSLVHSVTFTHTFPTLVYREDEGKRDVSDNE